jgi:hypothetical protein
MVHISEAGWTGTPVEVVADPEPVQGTVLRFKDEEWTLADVEPHAVFTGLQVRVDGQVCSQETFISPKAIQHPELGCRIEIRQTNDLQPWHRSVRRGAEVAPQIQRFAVGLRDADDIRLGKRPGRPAKSSLW